MSKLGVADIAFFIAFGGVMLGMILIMATYIYWGYTRMDSMIGHLKNCSLVSRYRFYLDMGPWGRLMMVGGVAGCLAFSKILIKNGLLSPEDISNFPEAFKRKLVISHYIGWILLVSMFISVGGIKAYRYFS